MFIALTLPDGWAQELDAWRSAHLAHGNLRPVPIGNLHLTLAFLGRRGAGDVEAVREVLGDAKASVQRPVLKPVRYRETERVAMLVLVDEGGHATELQTEIATRLAARELYRPEQRRWLPHVTVARVRGSRPKLSPPVPALPAASPSEVALYSSVLRQPEHSMKLSTR